MFARRFSIFVIKIIDHFLNAYGIFWWLLAIVDEAAKVAVAGGINIDGESGLGLLGSAMEAVFLNAVVVFGVEIGLGGISPSCIASDAWRGHAHVFFGFGQYRPFVLARFTIFCYYHHFFKLH